MRISIIIILLLSAIKVFPCTTFVLKTSKDLVFGRNLDWVSDNGIIVVNNRNQFKESLVFPPNKPVKWISKYGSITFNQFGKELPFGGMNEKGLVIEIMVADAEYPTYDNRGAVNELQWIQYNLDNAANIDDIIANDKKIRISKVSQNLHFLVCDKYGNTAVIEFKNHQMVVYRDSELPIPVLENSTYTKSLNDYRNNISCRFTKATNMLNKFDEKRNKSAVNYSFDILNKVALDGSWSIVYDIKNMKIHFKTASERNIKTINFRSFDFECTESTLVFDLLSKKDGDITNQFVNFNSDINRKKMVDAIRTNEIILPKEILEMFYNYHKTVECNN